MLQALQTAQEEADAALTEVQPRRRATNVETKAKVARAHEAVALFHIVASLLFAHILVTVCLKTMFGHYCVYGRGRQGGCDAT